MTQRRLTHRNTIPTMPDLTPQPWMDQAACLDGDPDRFFPNSALAVYWTAPIAICRQCPVRGECLEYALEVDERHGIWGGLTPHERQLLKRRQVKARRKARL